MPPERQNREIEIAGPDDVELVIGPAQQRFAVSIAPPSTIRPATDCQLWSIHNNGLRSLREIQLEISVTQSFDQKKGAFRELVNLDFRWPRLNNVGAGEWTEPAIFLRADGDHLRLWNSDATPILPWPNGDKSVERRWRLSMNVIGLSDEWPIELEVRWTPAAKTIEVMHCGDRIGSPESVSEMGAAPQPTHASKSAELPTAQVLGPASIPSGQRMGTPSLDQQRSFPPSRHSFIGGPDDPKQRADLYEDIGWLAREIQVLEGPPGLLPSEALDRLLDRTTGEKSGGVNVEHALNELKKHCRASGVHNLETGESGKAVAFEGLAVRFEALEAGDRAVGTQGASTELSDASPDRSTDIAPPNLPLAQSELERKRLVRDPLDDPALRPLPWSRFQKERTSKTSTFVASIWRIIMLAFQSRRLTLIAMSWPGLRRNLRFPSNRWPVSWTSRFLHGARLSLIMRATPWTQLLGTIP
jgi:hypothetical protein